MPAFTKNPHRNLIVQTFDSGNQQHLAALPEIIEWGADHCVASPVDKTTGKARHMLGAVAMDEETREICGYGAIKRPWSLSVVEFGGLVVARSARREKAATKITHYVIERWRAVYPHKSHTIIAFANERSAKVFEQLGAEHLGTKQEYLTHQPHGPVNQSSHWISPDSPDNQAFDLTPIAPG